MKLSHVVVLVGVFLGIHGAARCSDDNPEVLLKENQALRLLLVKQQMLVPALIKAEVTIATREMALREVEQEIESAQRNVRDNKEGLSKQYELLSREANSAAREELQSEYDRLKEASDMVLKHLETLENRQRELGREVTEARKSLQQVTAEYESLTMH